MGGGGSPRNGDERGTAAQVTGDEEWREKAKKLPVMSITEHNYLRWTSRRAQGTRPGAHLSSELADALARLQDGDLHLFRGLFGMCRLLRGVGNKT